MKLSKVIKVKEGCVRTMEEKVQELLLKGWDIGGCSSNYVILVKELPYDEVICYKATYKTALIYVVKKDNLFGLIDEFGQEICPCHFVEYEYTYNYEEIATDEWVKDRDNPSHIILKASNGDKHTYYRNEAKFGVSEKVTVEIMKREHEKFRALIEGKLNNEEESNE